MLKLLSQELKEEENKEEVDVANPASIGKDRGVAAGGGGLEKHGGRDVESLAQSFDMGFVSGRDTRISPSVRNLSKVLPNPHSSRSCTRHSGMRPVRGAWRPRRGCVQPKIRAACAPQECPSKCKRKMRELRWAAEREFDERDHTRSGARDVSGGGTVQGPVSSAAGDGDFLQGVAAGGGAADAAE